jgi:hypothetical protein
MTERGWDHHLLITFQQKVTPSLTNDDHMFLEEGHQDHLMPNCAVQALSRLDGEDAAPAPESFECRQIRCLSKQLSRSTMIRREAQ